MNTTTEETVNVNGTVSVTHHSDDTVTFVVWLEDGEAASGQRYGLKQAAHAIGSAFLLHGDR